MVVNYALIGSRIKELRKAQGLSQEALAERVDISTTHMSHIETGNTKLSLQVFTDLAEALQISVDSLLYFEMLIYDCSAAEKRFLFDILKAAKEAIRKNGWIMGSHTVETK